MGNTGPVSRRSELVDGWYSAAAELRVDSCVMGGWSLVHAARRSGGLAGMCPRLCMAVAYGDRHGDSVVMSRWPVDVESGVGDRPSLLQHSWAAGCTGEPLSSPSALGQPLWDAGVYVELVSRNRRHHSHKTHTYCPFERMEISPDIEKDI